MSEELMSHLLNIAVQAIMFWVHTSHISKVYGLGMAKVWQGLSKFIFINQIFESFDNHTDEKY